MTTRSLRATGLRIPTIRPETILGSVFLLVAAACEPQKTSSDGGVAPDRVGPDAGSEGGGGTGQTGSSPGSPQVPGRSTAAEPTPDCPVPVKPPVVAGTIVGQLCEENLALDRCQPIAGAQVGYHVTDLAPVCLRGRATSDADGRFRLSDVEPGVSGRYSVLVLAGGYLQRNVTGFWVEEGGEQDLGAIPLRPSVSGALPSSLHRATIAGRVCGASNLNSACAPIAGARVGYRPSLNALPAIVAEGRTDHDGRFAIPGVDPASFAHYTLSVVAKGHYQQSMLVDEAPPGSNTWSELKLEEAAEGVEAADMLTGTLAGEVCTMNGFDCQPVPNAEVSVLGGVAGTGPAILSRADGRGRFGFAGVKADPTRVFTIACKGPSGAQGTVHIHGLDMGSTEIQRCTLQ